MSTFIAFTVFSCDKSEVHQVDQISLTSLEADLTVNTPLQLNQIMSFLDNINIEENSILSKNSKLPKANLVVASYAMPPGNNVAAASNGETIGINGYGNITLKPKSVCGGGSWVHKDANGVEIASGLWEAEQILNFKDYDPSPAEGWPAFIHAVKSIMRIHLGEPAYVDAILTIYCILPEVQTPTSWPEGIKIAIQNGGPNFNQVLPGGTFFANPWPFDPLCPEEVE